MAAYYNEIESHLLDAAKALRCAYKLCKNNGSLPNVENELAKTTIDVEEACGIIRDARQEINHVTER